MCSKHEKMNLGLFSVENIRRLWRSRLPISGPCSLFPILLSYLGGAYQVLGTPGSQPYYEDLGWQDGAGHFLSGFRSGS